MAFYQFEPWRENYPVECFLCGAFLQATSPDGIDVERRLFEHLWCEHSMVERCWCGFSVLHPSQRYAKIFWHVIENGGALAHYLESVLGGKPSDSSTATSAASP
jgi:hypothetical protein